jgi:DNA-binding NarL/FixJ family response regulator
MWRADSVGAEIRLMRNDKKIRVLICNKYTLFREGIKALLAQRTSIEIVGEAATAKQALDLLERMHPDVVLMDATIPDLSGSEATRRIKAIDPSVAVLILSLYDDEPLISGCLTAGASGYIGKNDRSVQLETTIDAACRPGAHATYE